MEPLITVDEVIKKKLLPFAESTIREYCRTRKLPCYKLVGTFCFRESELEKWIQERKLKPIDRVQVELIREVKI